MGKKIPHMGNEPEDWEKLEKFKNATPGQDKTIDIIAGVVKKAKAD
jgi:hypothetical protein